MSAGRGTDKHAWDSYAELMAKQNGIQRTRGDASPYVASTTRAQSPSEASSTGKYQKQKQRGGGRSTAAPNPFLGAPANSRDIYTIDAVQDENSLEDVALDTNVRDAPRGFGTKQSGNASNTVRVVVTDEGSQQRDAKIDQLARTVAAQDQEIRRLRGVAATNNAQRKTFPPCYPVVRQHIREDIPSDRQYIVRIAFFNWCLTTLAFLVNILVMFLQLVIASGSAASFILAALIAAIGIPVSWLGWYKNLYRSQITDAGTSYVKFFVHGFIHILWCIFAIVGPNLWKTGVPMAGVLNISNASDGGIGLVILNIIAIALWGLSLLVMLSVFKFANSRFRNKPPT